MPYDPGLLFSDDDRALVLSAVALIRDMRFVNSGRPDDLERVARKIAAAMVPPVAEAIRKAQIAENSRRKRAYREDR